MLEKYEICLGLFHGFDLRPLIAGTAQQRISMIPAGQEFILAQERGKERFFASRQGALRGLRAGGAA
jgi:type I restriction enzyme, R subunit